VRLDDPGVAEDPEVPAHRVRMELEGASELLRVEAVALSAKLIDDPAAAGIGERLVKPEPGLHISDCLREYSDPNP